MPASTRMTGLCRTPFQEASIVLVASLPTNQLRKPAMTAPKWRSSRTEVTRSGTGPSLLSSTLGILGAEKLAAGGVSFLVHNFHEYIYPTHYNQISLNKVHRLFDLGIHFIGDTQSFKRLRHYWYLDTASRCSNRYDFAKDSQPSMF